MDNIIILKQLDNNINKTQAYNTHRKYWLMASVFVVAVIIGVVYQWNLIEQKKLLWVVVSFGMTVTALWWYWTMKFVRHLIQSKIDESKILSVIIQDLQFVRNEILETIKSRK